MSQKVLQAEQLASCVGHESMQSYGQASGLFDAVLFWASQKGVPAFCKSSVDIDETVLLTCCCLRHIFLETSRKYLKHPPAEVSSF